MVLEVEVKDVNDNSPVFEKAYTAAVREDVPSNQYIIQVRLY